MKNNIDRFPDDFIFQLNRKEWNSILKCKNFTSSWGGTRKLPFAFTEQGIYMLTSVLNGDLAIKKSISLIQPTTLTLKIRRKTARKLNKTRHNIVGRT